MFGCCRVVGNDALAICKQSEKFPSSNELQKLVITQAKKTLERQWLSKVSNIPLQQSVAALGIAYKNFFDSLKGKRKRKKLGSPKFKKKVNRQAARFRIGGFSLKGKEVYLAKIGNVKPIWSRDLPSAPSSVTVIKDCADRYFLSFVVDIEPEMLNFDTKLYISRYSKTNQVKFSTKHEFLKPMNKTNFLTHTSLKIANLI